MKTKKKNKITKEIEIEDLVQIIPKSVVYLREKGIRCLRCGEPIWGSLENAAIDKGFSEKDIEKFVADLNELSRK
jgi:methionine synthase II (cobalamin-independent)